MSEPTINEQEQIIKTTQLAGKIASMIAEEFPDEDYDSKLSLGSNSEVSLQRKQFLKILENMLVCSQCQNL